MRTLTLKSCLTCYLDTTYINNNRIVEKSKVKIVGSEPGIESGGAMRGVHLTHYATFPHVK